MFTKFSDTFGGIQSNLTFFLLDFLTLGFDVFVIPPIVTLLLLFERFLSTFCRLPPSSSSSDDEFDP